MTRHILTLLEYLSQDGKEIIINSEGDEKVIPSKQNNSRIEF